MSLWRQLTRGLRSLLRRSAAEREIRAEVRHYLEEATAQHVARGLAPAAARRAARLELGSMTSVADEVRGYGWENVVATLVADVRYGVRRLLAEPGFTAITVLTLAIGMGAVTAIFSAVNPILFRSLPYPQAERIVMIWDMGADGARLDATFGTRTELGERSRSFDAIAVMRSWQPTSTGGEEPERLEGQRVSASYFRVLGVSPATGRDFRLADDVAGGPRVVILSDALWRRRFNGERGIAGRSITLDDERYVVAGVMPPEFENVLAPSAELWTLLQYDMTQPRAWGHHLRMAGRLRPAVGVAQAVRELDAIASAPLAEFARPPWASLENGFIVTPLQADITRAVRPALLLILVAVTLLLAIACVNVTNLLIARGARRQGEFALRLALGAGRGRLVRQLLTESLLLALLGGLCGMAVAWIAVRALIALSPPGLPRVGAITVDGSVFVFALCVTTVIGLLSGAIPALQAARSNPNDGLQRTSRRVAGGHGSIRSALVVAEVALALVLLVSSGLLLRSVKRLFDVDAGFDSGQLLSMQVQASGRVFESPGTTAVFFARVLEAVRQVPGVTSAAFTSQLPLSGDDDLWGVHFDPAPTADPGEVRGTFRYAVSTGYIETMRIAQRLGRPLRPQDGAAAPRVALISESLARRRLAGADPVGRRLRIGAQDGPLFTIVGVVADVKQLSLAASEADAVYVTTEQWHFQDLARWLVVRASGDVAALAPAVRRAIRSIDANQPIVRVATMVDLVARSAAERRFALILFEAFALAALVLAAAGIYGVISSRVAERTREIGVRSALGGSRRDILALVVRQGMTLAGLGVAIGVLAAAPMTRALVTLLYGISPLDPLTWLSVIALLAGAALLACAVPAWHAAHLDPARTLRAG